MYNVHVSLYIHTCHIKFYINVVHIGVLNVDQGDAIFLLFLQVTCIAWDSHDLCICNQCSISVKACQIM
jgi:hypothetical protein